MNFLGRELSPHHLPMIVAEISCNHEGSLESCLNLIKKAKYAEADAVKIQCYTADEMTIDYRKFTPPHNGSGVYEMHTEFIIDKAPWNGQHLYDLYKRTQTPPEWMPKIFEYAKSIDIPLFASVFGTKSLEALEQVGCPAYKIASFEVNDTNLLKLVAKTGKPVILSTGAATSKELSRAEELFTPDNVIIMHCVSKYPALFRETELSQITHYRQIFGNPIGFSDHTNNSKAAMIAVALGASILEKHFGESMLSEDASFSSNSEEFSKYVSDCKAAWEAMQLNVREENSPFKRSLYVVQDIKEGEKFTKENIRSIRPGYGLDPYLMDILMGKTCKFNLPKGTALKKEMINE